MKKCPFCAEEIQDGAIKCRYCGEMLPSPGDVATTDTPRKTSVQTNPFGWKKTWIWLGALTLIPILALFVAMMFASKTSLEVDISKRLDVTYDQVMKGLENSFVMESVAPYKEQDRYMGRASDDTVGLEIIGSKENIIQATLSIMQTNNPSASGNNMLILGKFIINMFPEKESKVVNWVIAAVPEMDRLNQNSREKNIGNKKIRINYYKSLGTFIFSVFHK